MCAWSNEIDKSKRISFQHFCFCFSCSSVYFFIFNILYYLKCTLHHHSLLLLHEHESLWACFHLIRSLIFRIFFFTLSVSPFQQNINILNLLYVPKLYACFLFNFPDFDFCRFLFFVFCFVSFFFLFTYLHLNVQLKLYQSCLKLQLLRLFVVVVIASQNQIIIDIIARYELFCSRSFAIDQVH